MGQETALSDGELRGKSFGGLGWVELLQEVIEVEFTENEFVGTKGDLAREIPHIEDGTEGVKSSLRILVDDNSEGVDGWEVKQLSNSLK